MFFRPEYAVLFVCTANICRSPIAQGLLRRRCDALGVGRRVRVDSAGVSVAVPGHRPDPRAQAQLSTLDIKIHRLRARQVVDRDFDRFDFILGMSQQHLAWLHDQQPEGSRARLGLVMDFAAASYEAEVPDPYYSNEAGFARVLELLQQGVDGFVESLLEQELRRLGLL